MRDTATGWRTVLDCKLNQFHGLFVRAVRRTKDSVTRFGVLQPVIARWTSSRCFGGFGPSSGTFGLNIEQYRLIQTPSRVMDIYKEKCLLRLVDEGSIFRYGCYTISRLAASLRLRYEAITFDFLSVF